MRYLAKIQIICISSAVIICCGAHAEGACIQVKLNIYLSLVDNANIKRCAPSIYCNAEGLRHIQGDVQGSCNVMRAVASRHQAHAAFRRRPARHQRIHHCTKADASLTSGRCSAPLPKCCKLHETCWWSDDAHAEHAPSLCKKPCKSHLAGIKGYATWRLFTGRATHLMVFHGNSWQARSGTCAGCVVSSDSHKGVDGLPCRVECSRIKGCAHHALCISLLLQLMHL